MRHSEAIDKYLAPFLWRKAVKSSQVKYLAPLLGRIGKARQGKARQVKYLAPLLCRKVGRQVEQAALHDQDGRLPRAGRDPKERFLHLQLQLEHALLVPDERGNQ